MDFSDEFRVKPGKKVKLSRIDPDFTGLFKDRKEAEKPFQENLEKMRKLQYTLYAENKKSLLLVFQAMDAGGKDGTIRHVMFGLNPQGCRVTSFKEPSKEELSHDFLWRIHKEVPPKGEIGIFNRSHYEDVLIVRVHDIVPEKIWSKRYRQINQFEETLSSNNVVILKFFLHIGFEEQKERIRERIENPSKNWKVTPEDFKERKYWDDYMEAYEDAISECNTKEAPWFVIPANKKWFRNLAVSAIIRQTLEEMHPKYPEPKMDLSKVELK